MLTEPTGSAVCGAVVSEAASAAVAVSVVADANQTVRKSCHRTLT